MGASQQEQNSSKLLGTIGGLSSGLQTTLDQGPKVFTRSLYAGQGTDTKGGIAGLLSGAQNPAFSRGAQGALDLTSDVAAGNRFGEEAPGYAALRQGAIDDAQTGINRSFLSSGTYGSDKHREALGKGIGSAVAGLDYQNYTNDIARQERAQANLPGLLQGTLLPSQIQLQTGQIQDANTRAKLLAEQDLFRRKNDARLKLLSDVGGIVTGTAGANAGIQEPVPWWQSAAGFGAGLAGNFVRGGF